MVLWSYKPFYMVLRGFRVWMGKIYPEREVYPLKSSKNGLRKEMLGYLSSDIEVERFLVRVLSSKSFNQ